MLSVGIPRLEGRLEERFTTVLARIERYAPTVNREMLTRAYEFAVLAHDGQMRKSGDPYVTHPIEVANILAELELDEATIAAALLHDTIEDGIIPRPDGEMVLVTREVIDERFGPEIGALVQGVTKLGTLEFPNREARQAESLRRMLLATARDVRVILIKLADRFHNMRTLKYLKEADQRRIADETMRIFAPIAHRLGVWKIKWELEDQSLRALEPEAYREIQLKVNRTRAEREAVVTTALAQIGDRLRAMGIDGDVIGRPKHFFSIYNKMREQDVDFAQILDLEAIRVVVDTVPECYSVLGEVHTMWMPLRDMFTDYIAKPKPNLYQSLHTKVLGPHGQPLEVQIRTREMHKIAEMGIAAHWHYKEGGSRDVQFEQKLAWVRGLLEGHSDAGNEADWLESLKADLFKDQVFVFTPAGDIVDLPAGATPIDFAYRIHTDIGARCAGAKVNGRLVPLDHQFQNGDVAEIIVKANQRPSLDWLRFVATSAARNRIKQYFRKANREENIVRGRHALDEECKRQGLPSADLLKPDKLQGIATRQNLTGVEDLYALIGYGELTAEGVMHRLRDDLPKRSLDELRTSHAMPEQGELPIHVPASGIDGILFRLSKCCRPIPGDTIVGYVTRGKGVTIHRVDCPNLAALRAEPSEAERLMSLEWEDDGKGTYLADVEIVALDRTGLMADIYAVFSETKTNIRSGSTKTNPKTRTAHTTLQVDVSGQAALQEIIRRINTMSDVLQVHRRRTTGG
jgi:GTP pyrophosphokinase